MLGAFRPTSASMGGLLLKRRFRLTEEQKRRLNRRLRAVDANVQTIVDSGVRVSSLYEAAARKTQPEMLPREKYWVESKRYKNGFKPVHWVPHWTKVPHPTVERPAPMHQPIIPKDSTRLPSK